MKKTFTYCLLQYHHSLALGEVLNIGLLIYLPLANEIRFIYPNDLNRLKAIYPDFHESSILSYFEYFQIRVNELNHNSDFFYKYEVSTSLKELVAKEFLPADSSMLQFGNYKKGVLYNNMDGLLKKLSSLYFYSGFTEIKQEDNFTAKLSSKKTNKKEWIKADLKNKIVRIDKDFIFLPNKNELSF